MGTNRTLVHYLLYLSLNLVMTSIIHDADVVLPPTCAAIMQLPSHVILLIYTN